MSLIYTPEEEAFRAEVRTFLQNEYPEEVKEVIRAGKRPNREQMIAGQKALAKGGYAAPKWPVEWGGKDWTPMQSFIFSDEVLENDIAPTNGFGIGLLAPVITEFATQEQKERFLPAIYNA
ncbi:MAG TPA: acyl-CoA dehydrogenase family protein, partial [Microbacteriaceae bacterium]|nr:acyl-CoA dehydrogenase family protein [Microbacteriaceae bacterium]